MVNAIYLILLMSDIAPMSAATSAAGVRVTAPVPAPRRNAPAVRVALPVPPAATGKVPACSTPLGPVNTALLAAVPTAPSGVMFPWERSVSG